MGDRRLARRAAVLLLMPLVVAVDAARLVWRGWIRIAATLERMLLAAMWPMERLVDLIVWLADAVMAIPVIWTLPRRARSVVARRLAPLEHLLRRAGLRIHAGLGSVYRGLTATLAPVSRLARPSVRLLRRLTRGALQLLRAGISNLRRRLSPALRTMRTRMKASWNRARSLLTVRRSR